MTTCVANESKTGAEHKAPKLPPGPREWTVYRLVKVQQLTTREAAKQLGISQTRVCQLIERVIEYLSEIAPGCESPEARGRRIYIAESVAAERIDFLFRRVVDGYEKSIGEQKIIRETCSDYRAPTTSIVKRHSSGDGRLAVAAARLAQLGGKMPANTLLPEVPDDLPADLNEEELCEDTSPPVEDCSTTAREQAVTTTAAAKVPDVTAASPLPSAEIMELAAMLKFLESRPVQTPAESQKWDAFIRQDMQHSKILQEVLAEG